jgi:hypothetical protein
MIIIIVYGYLDAKNEITVFEGGRHRLDLSFYSTFFMGQTARSRNFGNTHSSSLFDTHLISMNPAGMTRSGGNLLTFDFAPGFGFDINNIYSGLQDEMNSMVDSAIERDLTDDARKSYPTLSTDIGQSGWINQFGLIIYDEKYGSFGFSWHRPFYLDMNYIGNGINFTVQDRVERSEGTHIYNEITLLPLSIELFNATKITMHQSDFSYGRELFEAFSVGGGLRFSNISIRNNLDANIGGFIRQYGGDTDIYVAFDDPNVAYRNTLKSYMDVDFKGNFVGGVISTSYAPTDRWIFDMVYETTRSSRLSGSLHIVQHTLGALNLNPDDDQDTFDVGLLQPAKIAYTNRTEYVSNDMSVHLPGKFAISSAYISRGHFVFILSVEKLLGNLRLDYSCVRYEDGERKNEDGVFEPYQSEKMLGYRVGISPKYAIKLAMGCDHFGMSLQLTVADIIADNVRGSDGEPVKPIENIIIPGLGFGTTLSLSRNTMLDLSLVALPSPFFRSSLSWKF